MNTQHAQHAGLVHLGPNTSEKVPDGAVPRALARNIKRLMVLSGLLTCTMIYAVIAPDAALMSTFGDSLEGPLAHVVVRSWGVLITLIGGMLLYGAFNPAHRRLVAVVAATSKLSYAVLVLSFGSAYLSRAAWVIGFDLAVAFLLFMYVLTVRPGSEQTTPG